MSAAKLRIFFASDIHGSEVCFRKFLNAADFYEAEVLILGGDITGKFIVPIFKSGEGYLARFADEECRLTSEEALGRFMQRVRDSGCYPYLTTREEWAEILSDESRMIQLFTELMRESVQRWVRLAESKLGKTGSKCFIMPGNDDSRAIDDILDDSEVIVNPNEKVVELAEGLQMLSLGYSNITPWRCPRDISEEELGERIERLMVEVDDAAELVFNIHVPPYDSGIDSAPELDEHMRPRIGPGGQVIMAPVGSRAVRRAIERYQPLLSLHGHIHEARGFARIGRTLCLNPGSEYQEGVLRGVLIQLDRGKIRDFIFTSG